MRAALIAFLIFYGAVCVAREQGTPGTRNPGISDRKVDEYGNLPWADEKRRLDALAEELSYQPEAVSYLIVYDGRRGCRGEARRRAVRAKQYLVGARGVRPGQVVWRYGGHRKELTVDVWVVPPSGSAPVAHPTVAPREVRPRACGRKGRRRRAKS